MSTRENGFSCWAIVEVMGHHRFAGHVSETTIAGAGFVRLDVPESGTAQAFSKLFAPASLYAITPVSEAVARELAAGFRAAPVNEWDLPRLRAPEPRKDEPVAERVRGCRLCEYPAPDAFCARCGADQEEPQEPQHHQQPGDTCDGCRGTGAVKRYDQCDELVNHLCRDCGGTGVVQRPDVSGPPISREPIPDEPTYLTDEKPSWTPLTSMVAGQLVRVHVAMRMFKGYTPVRLKEPVPGIVKQVPEPSGMPIYIVSLAEQLVEDEGRLHIDSLCVYAMAGGCSDPEVGYFDDDVSF